MILLSILAVLAAAGYLANQKNGPAKAPPRIQLYASVIVGQLLLVRYVRIGIRGMTLGELTGRSSLVLDIVIAAAMWGGASLLLDALRRGLGGSDPHVTQLLPATLLEKIIWVLLSITAGVCEEIVYRGYLQRQFSAWSGSTVIGVIAQVGRLRRLTWVPGLEIRRADHRLRSSVRNDRSLPAQSLAGNDRARVDGYLQRIVRLSALLATPRALR
jgi:hypothetical protein